MHDLFVKIAHKFSEAFGSPWMFFAALLLVIFWFAAGFVFNLSDRWLQSIDTITAIITFLMVFIIQNTQNRDTESMELKLDELIRANKQARNKLIDLEELSDKEMDKLQEEFRKMGKKKRVAK